MFVDHTATGANNGTSWDNAFTSLQDALAGSRAFAPAESVEIWVAKGIYFPDVGAGLTNNDRSLSFRPAANVDLYGGFAGSESSREQRDWEAHPTVLSGDIDGNDTVDVDGVALSHADIKGNNSYHVVVYKKIGGRARLDGLVITSGQATGGNIAAGLMMREGAGLYSHNSNVTLANVRIQGNKAVHPGGGVGGAIYAKADTQQPWDALVLDNVQLIANASDFAGGMYATVNRIYVYSSAFIDNEATDAGVAFMSEMHEAKFSDSVFRGNRATNRAGAIWSQLVRIAMVNCEFTGNHAGGNGGAWYEDNTVHSFIPVFTNVVFSGNSAGDSGGAIFRLSSINGHSRLYNSIIWNNQDSSGVGTASANHGGPGGAFLNGTNSLVQSMNPNGPDNLDGMLAANNPLFQQALDPAMAPSIAGDFHLQPNSPLIDRGNNQVRSNPFDKTAIPLEGKVLTDLDGKPRIVDADGDAIATVDLGPYELAAYTVGGSVSGLTGAGLVLQNNAGDDLTISGNGAFTFAGGMPALSSYAVTVLSQPSQPSQTCTVSNGSGTVNDANVSNVQVSCDIGSYLVTPTATIGGNISPATVQSVNDGATTRFTLTPAANYHVDSVAGTCDGILSGLDNTIYTTASVTQDCTVVASFAPDGGGNLMCSEPLNHDIENSYDGTFIKWETGEISDGTSIDGADFNAWGRDGKLGFYWPISGNGAGAAATAPGKDWLVLQGGDQIGPSSVFSTALGEAENWAPGVDGYLGFKFSCSTAGTCFGYAHMTTTGPDGLPATLVDYCFDRAGDAVTIPATYIVSASVGTGNGTIAPDTAQSVIANDTIDFALAAGAGFHIASVGGTCGGALLGNIYTTAAVTADCTVVANFALNTYTVGGNASGLIGSDLVLRLNGSNSLLVNQNGAFVFAHPLDDLSSYAVTIAQQPTSPNQVCAITDGDGAIDGSDIDDVAVVCADTTPQLSVSVTDNHDYARYGKLINYIVTVTNDGTGDATGISVKNLSPPQIDTAFTTWTCGDTGGSAICGSGSGALDDTGVAIPIGRSLTWLVTAPLRGDASGNTVDYSVDVSGPATASATDSNTLVIMRSGFDVAYGDGAESIIGAQADTCIRSSVSDRFDSAGTHIVALNATPMRALIDHVFSAGDSHAAGFRIERLNLSRIPQIRIVTLDANGVERAGNWAAAADDTVLAIASTSSGGQSILLVEGTDTSLSLPLPPDMDAAATMCEPVAEGSP